MTEPTTSGTTAGELAQQVMPSVLELQRVLLAHAGGGRDAQEIRGYVSLTSCYQNSCAGPTLK
ncbi:hypothetical protein J7W19_26345 [Streptomyces mobaraensis NBRC 13819 = DSM 40847]|uniref:Uncharacterized protein n=2 Tax=Streptomyces mobaraensis TaxID=35621 RepID=A0A5N5W0Q0_STRMB|nr:hypothetical protein [Streptomyces mobaraensis]KAB7834246.1 hypothetical protein FRZ00_30020 [Streptomyces mobaraensis]QTT76427.1 hypothetical protein J7W19_26345 [Streptomyces mobaraensis NBRC 13819 = DSM 40847]